MKETRIEYWSNGNKHIETNYLNGKKHGKQIFYYPDGIKISLLTNYFDGFEDGLFIDYGFSGGRIVEKISFKNDVLHGVRLFFYHTQQNNDRTRKNRK